VVVNTAIAAALLVSIACYLISLALQVLATSNPLNLTPPSSVSLDNSAAILCGTAAFFCSFLSSPVVSVFDKQHRRQRDETIVSTYYVNSIENSAFT
jgi:hypothetical protein